MSYQWYRDVLEWERVKGIFQPRAKTELLIGYLGSGTYPKAKITEVWNTQKYLEITLEVAGKGSLTHKVWKKAYGSEEPSWDIRRLGEALGTGSSSIDPTTQEGQAQMIGRYVPITIDQSGRVKYGATNRQWQQWPKQTLRDLTSGEGEPTPPSGHAGGG